MIVRPHRYAARIRWTGGAADATFDYATYSRAYVVECDGKAPLHGSADTHFRGDARLHNPEDLLVAALSACHLLSYLAVCARAGIVVRGYEDDARGEMSLVDGRIRFREVVLSPRVTIADASRIDEAIALHLQAHRDCFIASSVNFTVRNEPAVTAGAAV